MKDYMEQTNSQLLGALYAMKKLSKVIAGSHSPLRALSSCTWQQVLTLRHSLHLLTRRTRGMLHATNQKNDKVYRRWHTKYQDADHDGELLAYVRHLSLENIHSVHHSGVAHLYMTWLSKCAHNIGHVHWDIWQSWGTSLDSAPNLLRYPAVHLIYDYAHPD